MNIRQIAVQTALAVSLFTAAGCKHEPPSPEPKTTAAEDFQREKAEARVAMQRRLDELDNEIDKMGASIEKAGRKAKKGSKETMEKLKEEAKDLRARMSRAGDATAGTWNSAKRDFEDGAEKLGDGIKKARKEITD